MKKYIRTDTFKVFEKEDKILQSIIDVKKLSTKQGKSEAYRVALHAYEVNEKICESFDAFSALLNKVIEGQNQLYFVNQALVAEINELRQAKESQ